MLVKTILNVIEKFKAFVYGDTYWETLAKEKALVIELSSRKNSQGECKMCGQCCSTYDTQSTRDYEYVPL